jgi:hypothetical protein
MWLFLVYLSIISMALLLISIFCEIFDCIRKFSKAMSEIMAYGYEQSLNNNKDA